MAALLITAFIPTQYFKVGNHANDQSKLGATKRKRKKKKSNETKQIKSSSYFQQLGFKIVWFLIFSVFSIKALKNHRNFNSSNKPNKSNETNGNSNIPMIFNKWASKSNDFHWFFNVSSKSNEKPIKLQLFQ